MVEGDTASNDKGLPENNGGMILSLSQTAYMHIHMLQWSRKMYEICNWGGWRIFFNDMYYATLPVNHALLKQGRRSWGGLGGLQPPQYLTSNITL